MQSTRDEWASSDGFPFDLLDTRGIGVRADGRISTLGNVVTELPEERHARERFTVEDDDEVEEWATRALVHPVTALQAFRDFETMNDRHTASSWQARWRKISRARAEQPHLEVGEPSTASSASGCVEFWEGPDSAPPTSDCEGDAGELDEEQSDMEWFTPPPEQPSISPIVSSEAICPESGVTEGAIATFYPRDPSQEDESAVPPAHFRPLTHTEPAGRESQSQLRVNSEITLRQALSLRDRQEHIIWLTQPWVLDVYIEYAECVLDRLSWTTSRSYRSYNDSQPQRSSTTYIVNNAIEALRSRSQRYLADVTGKACWSLDNHDIRFIVRLVTAGREPGRWWERRSDGEIPQLCAIANRLAGWLRYVHTTTSGTGGTSQWHRANCHRWLSILRPARAQREEHLRPHPRGIQTGSLSCASTVPNRAGHNPDGEEVCVSDRSDGPSNQAQPDQGQAGLPHEPELPPHTIEHKRDQNETLKTIPGLASCTSEHNLDPFQDNPIPMPDNKSRVPDIPAYPTRPPAEMKSAERDSSWLSDFGRQKFQYRAQMLLAAWGVTADVESCVLVPDMWSGADPLHLLATLDLKDMPPKSVPRLTFNLAGHTTTHARASSWFVEHRRGIDLDNFFGQGPFTPMEGSHRCHLPYCINPSHIVYEAQDENRSRIRCFHLAHDLRFYGYDVPTNCRRHEPPCLLALAALTLGEAYTIQFTNLSIAKNTSLPTPRFQQPGAHPYPTFESRFPLSFSSGTSAIGADSLVDNGIEPQDPETLRHPTFYCRFCKVRSFKRISAYWFHIRDGHGLVQTEERLGEIRRTAAVWEEHLNQQRARGHGVRHDDRTWLKIQQIKAGNFGWEVVMAWKLRYQRER
ncbi:hypothetical protein PV08_07190 [Exophiala spinifera]|uniref:Zinc-binding loop region of homing endonuclease domain-containing protein n=1 Tax=Exophiala spinifera TaxID=91928 RepID=A0A0D2B6A2_9EURO|nr:uncharacterized protein PV08_07190 [Exophiala spinifera]KIW14408.1 hypothetical protein PV08_07190 [Exophiala spinifera]